MRKTLSIVFFFMAINAFGQTVTITSDSIMSPFYMEWIEHKNSIYIDVNGVSANQYVRFSTRLQYGGVTIFETDLSSNYDTLFYELADSANGIYGDSFALVLRNPTDTLKAGNNRIYAEQFMNLSAIKFIDSMGYVAGAYGKLSGGGYTITIQVYDTNYSSQLISTIVKSITVGGYQSSGLLNPHDNAYIYENRKEDVQFEWYPVSPIPDQSV